MNKAKDLKVMDNKHTTQSDSLRKFFYDYVSKIGIQSKTTNDS